jgi:multicomponent Na+:H+ antiporter subunit G
MIVAGNILIFAGIGFMLLGIIVLFRLNTFYARILIVAKIDILGSLTFIIGVAVKQAVKHGFGFFSLKLLLLAFLLLFINPLITHMMAHTAYMSKDKESIMNSEDNA